jgi:hypothetical protein
MPDARRTHGLACKNKKAHEQSHHMDAEARRHSLRDGFNNLFHALPGDRAFCHRHRRDAKHRRQQRVRNAQDSAGDLGARSTATDWHDGQIKVRFKWSRRSGPMHQHLRVFAALADFETE